MKNKQWNLIVENNRYDAGMVLYDIKKIINFLPDYGDKAMLVEGLCIGGSCFLLYIINKNNELQNVWRSWDATRCQPKKIVAHTTDIFEEQIIAFQKYFV